MSDRPRNEDSRRPVNRDSPSGSLKRVQLWALVVGLLGLVLATVLGVHDGPGFFRGYLSGFVLWIGIPLGCAAILMIHLLTGGDWGWSLRRLLQAGSSTLPLFVLLFLPILFGLRVLYAWIHGDHFYSPGIMQLKVIYFNLPFFLVRSAVYFILWIMGVSFLRRWSMQEDRSPTPALRRSLKRLAAGGLVAYAFTVSFAFIDWVGSLEVHWYSSIYGMYILIDQGLSALACLLIVLILSARRVQSEPDPISTARLNDLGNLLLAFVMLHAYIAFSQWLIIWNGDLPQEISWYEHRIHHGWGAVIVVIFCLQFCVPFAGLIFQRVKRSFRRLLVLSVVIFAASLLHAFWLVLPAFAPGGSRPIWIAGCAVTGIGGLWLWLFLGQWRRQGELFTPAPEELA